MSSEQGAAIETAVCVLEESLASALRSYERAVEVARVVVRQGEELRMVGAPGPTDDQRRRIDECIRRAGGFLEWIESL